MIKCKKIERCSKDKEEDIMGKIIVFLILTVISVILLLGCLVNGVRWGVCAVRHRSGQRAKSAFMKWGVRSICAVFVVFLFVIVTQKMASTPAIKDSNGKVVEGSIAELKSVELNGHKEWITVRGTDKNAPILLFLAGGPGGTQMAATRYELAELEKNFVVVNWDQPGSGKSYYCMKRKDITVRTYIEDGIALTEYLRETLGQEKIYLMGESWGSALGIFLINERPEYYAGFIGTGQMVDFAETEKIDYWKAMEIAKERGDEKKIKALTKQGEAPYYEGNIAWKSVTYLDYLTTYMSTNPEITNGGYHTFRDMFASEYGVLDSVNYMLGVMNTFNVVYPTLYGTDLRKDYAKLEVPVYFFLGRHDINAPTDLAEEYYNLLDAPKKEIVWFEHSGHSPWLNETERFVDETLRVFEK